MNFDKAGLGLMHMLAQAPDTKLWPSIRLMEPEDRPKHPIRTIEQDPNKYPIFRRVKAVEGMVDRTGIPSNTGRPTIIINKGGVGYSTGDHKKLASTLVHESEHINRGDDQEPPAYKKQFDFLRKIGHNDKDYLTGIFNRAKAK